MPSNTIAVAITKMILFMTSATSRLLRDASLALASCGPRHAKSASGMPIAAIRIPRMNKPRDGSDAKLWTDVSRPERTIKVPTKESENDNIASKIVQLFSWPLFSTTKTECINAVAASHGIRLAFSTGSQNHQPPQPNS